MCRLSHDANGSRACHVSKHVDQRKCSADDTKAKARHCTVNKNTADCQVQSWILSTGWHQSHIGKFQSLIQTRHRASTSTYSLTFCVRIRVATPAQYGRNGMASLQITSHTQQARRFYNWCERAACAGLGRLPLGSATHFHNVAIAMHPMHRLQIQPIVHN